jgi:serine/threonine protein kinase
MSTALSCPNCGQALAEGSRTCGRCGAFVCAACGSALLPNDRFCGKCGTSREGVAHPGESDTDEWQEIQQRLRKATLGEFEILRELGRGGMAAVFLAHQTALKRRVAIKVMAPGLIMGKGMMERFQLEAETVARLNHPNIVTIHTVRQAEGLHFFVMKLIPGRSLDRIIAEVGPLPLPVIQGLLYQVGSALTYAHKRGVIHRDVKPSNILMDEDGNAIVTDFGIAKVVETPSHTMTGATVGTPPYMSPEQCDARELTGASDQYSLGIVAYEMLTGKPPFTGPALSILLAHTQTPPPPIRSARQGCPPEIEAAVLRMLEKNPAHRWPSPMQAVEALGGRALGENDPLRERLTALGMRGPAELSVNEPKTPRSPIPSQPRIPSDASIGDLTVLPEPALVVSAPAATLRTGAAMQLSVKARDASGSPLLDPTLTWSSSDPKIATVSPAGVVHGTAPGSVTITARAREGGSGSVRIRVGVVPVGRVTVESPQTTLVVGDAIALHATVSDISGAIVTDRPITWMSSTPAVASVSPTGSVRALLSGIVTISASADGIIGETTLTIEAAAPSPSIRISVPTTEPELRGREPPTRPPWLWGAIAIGLAAIVALGAWLLWPKPKPGPDGTGISITPSPAELALRVGDSARVTALVVRADGDTLARGLSWSSENRAIADVSPSGMVVGKSAGKTTIIVLTRGATTRVPVTVTAAQGPASVASVEVRPPELRLVQGRSAPLGAVTRDSAGSVLEGRRIEWLSSDPSVARVSGSGMVSGVAAGQAIITATSEDVASEPPVQVTVEAAPAPARRAVVRMLIVPWAYVTIDGRGRGQRFRGEDTLSAGVPHTFRFERSGFVTFDTTLTLQPNEQALLRIQLKARKP